MTAPTQITRSCTPEEVAVIRAALKRVPVSMEFAALAGGLDALHTVSCCTCGCDSVGFSQHDPANPAKPIAERVGTTQAGGTVGVLVWGRADAVTGLEVYDFGAGESDLRLPIATSIRSFVAGESQNTEET